jgi:hypothetical protein
MEIKRDVNITKEQFLNASIKDISQVYTGARNCCRCGCGGTYIATSYMKNNRSAVDDGLVEGTLKRAKSIVNKGVSNVMYGDTFVDVQCGKNRTLTFYFDELLEI